MASKPFAIARVDGQPLAFAGLWEGWRSLEGQVLRTFAILTTVANAEMREVHDRMPVVLEPDAWSAWFSEDARELEPLMRPAPDGTLRLWPVSRDVNSPRHDRPDLVEPIVLPDAPRDEEEAGPDSA
jgi:putative SOS response-associated peptidase YedK